MSERKKKDLALWQSWQKDPGTTTLKPLLKVMTPVIEKEVNRWASGAVAPEAIRTEAKLLALNAFTSFNPEKSALNTHVTNQLKGLSRIVYTHSSPARMPEHRTIKARTFLDAEERLREKWNREPSNEELAKELVWSSAEVARFRSEQRNEFSTSQPVPYGFGTEDESGLLDFVYHDLNHTDQVVFEHTTGYGGAPLLSTKDLVSKSGLTPGQISHSKRRLKKIISTHMG
jgi:DNA-directed RNA polymerase specialized sigma subunit